MKLAKLTIGFDRGVKTNAPRDVDLTSEPTHTPDGGVVRGLGTHYVSPEAKERAERLGGIDAKIRKMFNATLVRAPFDGTYIVSDSLEAERLIAKVEYPRGEMSVRVAVYDFSPEGGKMKKDEMAEWAGRVAKQIAAVPLGHRSQKEVSAEGLRSLESLAACPLLAPEMRERMLALIAEAKIEKLDRVEFKRLIAEVPVQMTLVTVKPRRVAVERPETAGSPA